MRLVDIGIFAHNEEQGIKAMLEGLAGQNLFADPALSVRVLVLANGCRDSTANVARAVTVPGLSVIDLPLGGKSRTWNRFVHDLSRPDADQLIFCDADIALPQPDTLMRLVTGLDARPGLAVLNSRPVKDISHNPTNLSLTDRLIAAGSGGLDDWKTAICGQLYAMPAAKARRFHLPIGLPVEDGFLRAMILTDQLTSGVEMITRIDGAEGAFHLYASERDIPALIRHQTRIIIGSAVNAACFAHLRSLPVEMRAEALAKASTDDDWLASVLRARLPCAPHGYVPVHFALKRLERAFRAPLQSLHPRRATILILGLGFDLLVYLRAQMQMARGAGSGFW